MSSVASEASDVDRLVGVDRVLLVLRRLADHGEGVTLDDLTRDVGSPKPTVHRALAALRRAGFADQRTDGRYVLGDEVLRMAFAHHEARPEHVRIRPVLEALAARFGETAHYAVLDGRDVVYRAKVDPPTGTVRLTSVIGGRNPAHSTAVGKLLLANALPTQAAVKSWIGDRPLAARTPSTIRTAAALHRELETIRNNGYAVDDNESEVGINCIAVSADVAAPGHAPGAISVSALAYRTPLSLLVAAVDEIRATAGRLRGAA